MKRDFNFAFWFIIGMMLGWFILAAISQVAGCASSPRIVYTGTEPTIYATDQAALVPMPALPADPVWCDWQAPLNTEGFNCP